MELNRRDRILKLIVEHFIKTASPVGSQTLIEEYHLDFSSATIRSEMNALETDGLIEKTHTSSGRVPSSAGYRYYCSKLRNLNVDGDIKLQLQALLNKKAQSIEEVIKESCEILSHMTNLASIVLGPNADDEHLVSLQVIPISANTATAVFVTDKGYVENKTFVISDKMPIGDVEKCVHLLNDRLRGTAISHLVEKMEAIKPILGDYVSEHDVLCLSLYGKAELFEQPEFAHDADKLKRMIELLDSPEIFREASHNGDNITIKIGDISEEYNDVSIITSRIKIPGNPDGTIAVVGPTRMDYQKVVGALEYVVKALDEYFKETKPSKKEGDK
ncbi:MAG: heat-inducible transcriptional repressor HrcA [Firmicutes bacterium]|nr:heat-inducible transcriptional repressor HrcA [Bacillota bacterium]